MTGLPKNSNRAPITGGGRGRHNLHRVGQTAVTAPPHAGCVVWNPITHFFSVITGDIIVNHFINYISVLPFYHITDDQLKSYIHGVNSSINPSIKDEINELIIANRYDSNILSEIDSD